MNSHTEGLKTSLPVIMFGSAAYYIGVQVERRGPAGWFAVALLALYDFFGQRSLPPPLHIFFSYYLSIDLVTVFVSLSWDMHFAKSFKYCNDKDLSFTQIPVL